MLQLNVYQELALQTDFGSFREIVHVMGLAGESGEIVEKMKKALRDGSKVNKADIAKELGDVLWYVAVVANDMGYTLEQVAAMNLEKLEDRKRRGVLGGAGDNR